VRLAEIGLTLLASACVGPGQAGGLNPQALRDANEYSADRRGYSLLVSQHGRVVFEQYANGGSARTPHQIYSGTKSFWSVATLAASQDGWLGLDDRVSDTIEEWRGDGNRKDITIRELLNFTSGLDPNFHLHAIAMADRNATALKTPVVAARGKAFIYGPSHGQVLCEVLRRKLAARGESAFGYLRRKVLDPLAIGDFEYRKDARGNPLVATGFRLTARQWAKLGSLMLGRGSTGGRVIVQEPVFDQLLHGSGANPAFGLGLWLNRGARNPMARQPDIEDLLELPWRKQDWRGVCICKDAPPDLFAAVGSGYNRLFVIPSRGLVIVRQGKDANFSDAEFLRLILRQ
jgi:CubicO group peptidase (beta-lactamase class C family)